MARKRGRRIGHAGVQRCVRNSVSEAGTSTTIELCFALPKRTQLKQLALSQEIMVFRGFRSCWMCRNSQGRTFAYGQVVRIKPNTCTYLIHANIDSITYGALGVNNTSQVPRYAIEMEAVHDPVDQTDRFAAVGELIEYETKSTNTGNVDVTEVTMADSVGGCQKQRCT